MSEISIASDMLFEEILRDIVLSTTISAHKEIKKGRQTCGVCGTKCRSHNPLSNSQPLRPPSQSTSHPPPSRAPSPFPPSNISSSSSLTDPGGGTGRTGGYIAGPEKGTGGSTGIGSGSGRMDASGNVFFACLICDRQVVSSKYAPHLSSCLGMSGSTRRTASRSAAAAKAKMQSSGQGSQTSERSASPYVASEAGDSDDGSVGGKKGKKSLNGSVNGNGKRGPSPKKPGPAIKKARGSNGGTPSPLPRPALPPSKLGRPPTTSSTAYLSSPSPSPVPSLASLADSGETGGTGGATGARKTLPGLGGNVPAVPALIVPDDDSDVDDY